ncbi:hypothetical protein K440DRAFT_613325, partial [Wilcoxina mikolae CBS 423.85]
MSRLFTFVTVCAAVWASGVAAQIITPAPSPPPRYDQQLKRQIKDFNSYASALDKCYSTGAACQYPDYYGACQAEYKDLDYLWCLCTTGYYEAVHSCSSCKVSVGIASAAAVSTWISMDNAACDRQTSKMRTKSPELFSSGGSKKHSKSAVASGSEATATQDSQPASTGDSGIMTPTAPIIDELIGSKSTSSASAASESVSTKAGQSAVAGWQDRLVGLVGFVWIVFVAAIMM